MKLLVREKVRDILTLAMTKENENFIPSVVYKGKKLKVKTIDFREGAAKIEDYEFDLSKEDVGYELDEMIYKLRRV